MRPYLPKRTCECREQGATLLLRPFFEKDEMRALMMRATGLSIAMLFLLTGDATAQGQGAGARLRAFNEQLLRLHGQAQGAGPAQAALLRAKGRPVLAARAAALAEAIEEDPAQAAALAFPPELLARLKTAFPDSAAHLEEHGRWRGPVEYLIFDDHAMRSHRSLVRLKNKAQDLEIRFARGEPAGLKNGDLLEVQGVRTGSTVAATGGNVQAAATTCSTIGEQRSVVLMVTFPGVVPPAIATQSVADIFFGSTGRSLDGFWKEASYGKTWATGDVFGWLTLDAVYSCDQYYQMRDAAIRAADSLVDFTRYNRIFIIFPPQGSCSWAGLSNVGCGTLSTGDGSIQASTAWLVANYMSSRDQGVKLVTHEAGHGLTLGHACSRDFGAEALASPGTAGALSEYGDLFSTMGSWNLGHYSAPHKLRLAWLDAAANTRTVESNGAFAVQPMSVGPAGLQALKIRRGTGNNAWLWLEYRQPAGSYDSAIGSQSFAGALLHYDDGTAGSKTHLLDFTPETSSWSDPALTAAKTWVDPHSNVSLHVQSAASGGLNVNVEYGALPCVRADPSIVISPSNPAIYPEGTAVYTVSVTNKDSAGCAPNTYGLTSSAPGGWIGAFSASSLTLSPGQGGSVTMSKTAPAGAAPATYPVDASAASSSGSGAGTANCTVAAASPPLSVSLSVPAGPYSKNATVSMSATAMSGSSPAGGAAVTFRLVTPSGAVETKTATANSAGTAILNYKVTPKAPKGTWSATASATGNGQQAASQPAAFIVQ